MTLSVGDRIPQATLFVPGDDGPEPRSTAELFAGRKIVLVGMPGAFTPTCHRNHLPGFIDNRDIIVDKGVDEIAVLTTNDTHVMRAWAEATGAKGRIAFFSDGNGEFIRKAGLELDRSERGMGVRSMRFAAIIDDGVVTAISVEDAPGNALASSAARILEQL